MKTALKILVGIVIGLLLVLALLITLSGGWYAIPRARHFQKVVKTTDFSAVVRSAAQVIRKSGAGQGTSFRGKALKTLPKPIADMEPEDVFVNDAGMTISFAHGAEGFGLKIINGEEDWTIFSYPYRPESELVVLSFKKDPATGDPVGPPISASASAQPGTSPRPVR